MARPRNDGTPYKAKATTYKLKKDIIHKIQMGKSYTEITDWLVEEIGYTPNSARDMYSKAKKDVGEQYEKYIENVAKRNTERLNAIVDRAYDEGRLKDALSAIEILNKMTGQYTNKFEINTQEPIRITFG